MTIETKFNIGDLVQYKFKRPLSADFKNTEVAYEIIEIKANNCYTTAQVFYSVRPIHAISEGIYVDGKRVMKLVDFASGHFKETEYGNFREDELKPCDKELEALIKNDPQ